MDGRFQWFLPKHDRTTARPHDRARGVSSKHPKNKNLSIFDDQSKHSWQTSGIAHSIFSTRINARPRVYFNMKRST
jgi:hypothetical protein